jgi:hypothetical protein
MTSPEIQRASPAAVRKVVILVVIAAVVGLALIGVFELLRPALVNWLTEDPDRAVPRMGVALALLGAALVLPVLAFVVVFWRFALRVRAAGRFPPPGTTLVRDARVVTGSSATRLALLLQVVSIVLALIAIAMAAMLWRIFDILQRAAG